MQAPAPLPPPGGRVLAQWAAALAPYEPRLLWVGHVYLHRVELRACNTVTRPLELLTRHVLTAVALEAGSAVSALPRRLHLAVPVVQKMASSLAAAGLLRA